MAVNLEGLSLGDEEAEGVVFTREGGRHNILILICVSLGVFSLIGSFVSM